MRPLVALALLAGFTSAAPVPKGMKAKKGDAALLVGTWTTVPGGGSAYRFTFTADGAVTSTSGRNSQRWTWTTEPDETPKRMKWVQADDPATTWDCVYEVTDETFRIGFIQKGQPVPTELKRGSGLTLYEMTRDTTK